MIEGYGAGKFRISNIVYNSPVIVFPEFCVEWGGFDTDNVCVDSFSDIFNYEIKPDILLVGSGATTIFFPGVTRDKLRTKGVVIDVMNTGAACRTYNVLLTEGRSVAAALLPID